MLPELALSLICYGFGEYGSVETSTTWINGQAVQSHHSGTERVTDLMLVEVNGDTARIKPPSSVVPTLAGRGDNGWYQLSDLRVTDAEISGRFRLNWINSPSVTISRMTGLVQIDGGDAFAGDMDFTGECEPASAERRF